MKLMNKENYMDVMYIQIKDLIEIIKYKELDDIPSELIELSNLPDKEQFVRITDLNSITFLLAQRYIIDYKQYRYMTGGDVTQIYRDIENVMYGKDEQWYQATCNKDTELQKKYSIESRQACYYLSSFADLIRDVHQGDILPLPKVIDSDGYYIEYPRFDLILFTSLNPSTYIIKRKSNNNLPYLFKYDKQNIITLLSSINKFKSFDDLDYSAFTFRYTQDAIYVDVDYSKKKVVEQDKRKRLYK